MRIALILLLFAVPLSAAQAQQPPRPIRHVVMIGVDGMSPNGIRTANTPNLDRLMREGAWTFRARAVTPSVSSPNWASLIMGADVEQHGIHSNGYERNDFILPPVVRGSEDIFPTIFGEIHAQIPQAEIGAIYDWDGFGRLFEQSAVDYNVSADGEAETALKAAEYIRTARPAFCFVHLDHVDHAGHAHGHGSPKYYRSVERADSLIGQILTAIQEAGIAGETLVLVCADHGGKGHGHGGLSVAEMEVPLILHGPGIRPNYEIPIPVFQYDHAATIAFALGIEAPYAWIGRPTRCAFEGFDPPARSYPLASLLEAPVFQHAEQGYRPAGGLFRGDTVVQISHPEAGELRYTLDGSRPSAASPLYKKPLPLSRSTVVKCALFRGGKQISETAVAYYRFLAPGQAPAVRYRAYLLENASRLPDFSRLSPAAAGSCNEISSEGLQLPREEQVAVVFETQFEAAAAGEYAFFTRSDDGSKLYVQGKPVVDNDGDHGVAEVKGTMRLEAGLHLLRVEWFNGGGGGWLDVYVQGPDGIRQVLQGKP
ncbi:MAG: alkaline phosphatase family protein [Bacteroidia bacterium]|nr:alkaline phosphatase family protein [Bacteroidia bacterium]